MPNCWISKLVNMIINIIWYWYITHLNYFETASETPFNIFSLACISVLCNKEDMWKMLCVLKCFTDAPYIMCNMILNESLKNKTHQMQFDSLMLVTIIRRNCLAINCPKWQTSTQPNNWGVTHAYKKNMLNDECLISGPRLSQSSDRSLQHLEVLDTYFFSYQRMWYREAVY